MQFTKQITVDTSADKVWEILGTNFNDISEWASPVISSHAIPDLPAGSGRICQIKGLGETYERIENYNDAGCEFTFTLESTKLPSFMRRIENTWHVEPHGDNQAWVSVTSDISLLPVFSQLLSGKIHKGLVKSADELLTELKYFAENGKAIA